VTLLKQAADPSIVFSRSYIPGNWDCVIRWGNAGTIQAKGVELNHASALKRLYSRSLAARLLAVNRIPFQTVSSSSRSPRPSPAVYRIHIADMNPISVSALLRGKFRTITEYTSPRIEKAIRVARRTLYCLGLHFGRVDLGLTETRALKVISISAAPQLTSGLAKLYARAFLAMTNKRLSSKSIDPDTVVLGADPEFVMYSPSSKRVVFASDFFSKDGLVGYDNQSHYRDRRNHPIVEIRPRPSSSPAQIIHEMREALRLALQKTSRARTVWLAGSQPLRNCTTGGHIHFTGVPLSYELIRALDNYLAIPCMLIENSKRAAGRRPRYGFLGDIRTKPHGGFEYRTPASWLVAPHFAEAVLYLAKLIAVEHRSLSANLLSTPEAAVDFYKARKERFRPHIARLWADLSRTRYYEVCKDKIGIIKRLIDQRKIWQDRADIKKRWGL
jgi:hypothetical protein